MITIGTGNAGMKLATLFADDAILISTAEQDTANFSDFKVNIVSTEGCGKKYGTGVKLWSENVTQLESLFEHTKNQKVIIFSRFRRRFWKFFITVHF